MSNLVVFGILKPLDVNRLESLVKVHLPNKVHCLEIQEME